MKILRTLPLLVLLLAGVSCYGFHFVEDFQGQPWEQYPVDTGSNYTSNGVTLSFDPTTQGSGGTYIGVVDAGSGGGRADPFGGTGNRSLAIHADSTGTTVPRVNFHSSGLTAGTLSFDLYIDPNYGKLFHLFSTNGGIPNPANYGFVISVNSANGLRVADGKIEDGNANYVTVNSGFEQGQAYNLQIEFFDDDTYSVYLDGQIQSTLEGKDVFDFVNPQDSLARFQFASAWASTSNTARFWVDNITIIPESATIGGAMGGLLLLLVFFRWKKRLLNSKQ